MYSEQCWVRSAIYSHNVTVDSQGFVVTESKLDSNVTTFEADDNAPAGDLYRLDEIDKTSIATSFKMLNAFLHSSVWFGDNPKPTHTEDQGFLGSASIFDENFFQAHDPTSQVIYMLNDVYFRAGAIYGFPGSASIDPDLPL
jgi:hypothetical protein